MRYSLDFNAPDIVHPFSDSVTIAEVAQFLENKYHLIDKFLSDRQEAIIEYALTLDLPADAHLLDSFIQSEFREYIITESHNIKTRASQMQGREAFINSGAYYRGVSVNVKSLD